MEDFSEVNKSCIYFGLVTMKLFIALKFVILGHGLLCDY